MAIVVESPALALLEKFPVWWLAMQIWQQWLA